MAECIKLDTGVGPSIASGNQTLKIVCADLVNGPPNNKKLSIKQTGGFNGNIPIGSRCRNGSTKHY